MPRPRKLVPSYLLHAATGRGRAVWTDATGTRREKLLPGRFNSPESAAAFARLQLEIASGSPDQPVTSVAEAMLAYLKHAQRYYTDPAGNPSHEVTCIRHAIKPVRELYATMAAAEFGPKKLARVRDRMIEIGWCRQVVNRRVRLIVRAFKWLAAEELVPATVYHSLRTLAGLRAGKTTAPEAEPIRPVAEDVVTATLPHLPPHVRAMVEILWLTGMRPAEACRMTLGQIDRSGPLWTYRPAQHKTAYRGHVRSIPLGPKARAVLTTHMGGRCFSPDEPLFSPRRQREERFAALRAARKSKVQPSQEDRTQAKPKKLPGAEYNPAAVGHAVSTAAEKAGVAHWHPYQLRHAHATRVRREFGLEAAQVLLGHARADVTQIYAEKNEKLAADVAEQVG